MPSHLLTGGATGIAIIVYYLTQLPIGLQTFLYNIPLLMAAWKTLGHGYRRRHHRHGYLLAVP